ncbi:hypothetical protein M634_00010 [Vibrio parahaemolyticus O1:Kuk str. FDA_R31]|nr:hypothetical protein M634_00010 [Vibrio parahaemolyticus O1:Kuk str. FDA_R31]
MQRKIVFHDFRFVILHNVKNEPHEFICFAWGKDIAKL